MSDEVSLAEKAYGVAINYLSQGGEQVARIYGRAFAETSIDTLNLLRRRLTNEAGQEALYELEKNQMIKHLLGN